MSEAAIILQIFLEYGPALAKVAQEIFSVKEPTQADWDKFWDLTKVEFDTIVPKKV